MAKKSRHYSDTPFPPNAGYFALLIIAYAPVVVVAMSPSLVPFLKNLFLASTLLALVSVFLYKWIVEAETGAKLFLLIWLFLKVTALAILLLILFTPIFDFVILQVTHTLFCTRTYEWLARVNPEQVPQLKEACKIFGYPLP